MTDLILHHFDASPFAEKVRLALGLKNLEWFSVEIPMVMPKPALTALTGGYRKTPVLQVGANIYCDSQRIARAIEELEPKPTLFPDGSEGLAMALSQWSDTAFFQPGAGLSMGTNVALPEDVLEDRREFFNFLDFGTLQDQIPHLYAQFDAHLHLVQSMLADGRPYILGDSPGWVDILAYFPLWMARGNIEGTQARVGGLSALLAWETRMQSRGHGTPRPMPAEDALAIAHQSSPVGEPEIAPGSWPQLELDQAVTVTPQDYGAVPVAGQLVRLTHQDIAIRRSDPQAGELLVHFPRAGFRVEAIS